MKQEKKQWLKNNLSWVLLAIVSTIFIFLLIKGCKPVPVLPSNPSKDYIESLNHKIDSLLVVTNTKQEAKKDTITIVKIERLKTENKILHEYITKTDTLIYMSASVKSDTLSKLLKRAKIRDSQGYYNPPTR